MKRIWIRSILCLSMVVLGLVGMACSQTAEEQSLTGQETHERHATGIESQVGDH